MNRGHVGRLCVTEAGRLVGILTRSDLLRVFTRSDASLEPDVTQAVSDAVGAAGAELTVGVVDGIAYLRGSVERASTAVLAAAAARSVPGIVDVEDEVVAEIDDVTVVPAYVGV